jgi:hypothetical protein
VISNPSVKSIDFDQKDTADARSFIAHQVFETKENSLGLDIDLTDEELLWITAETRFAVEEKIEDEGKSAFVTWVMIDDEEFCDMSL